MHRSVITLVCFGLLGTACGKHSDSSDASAAISKTAVSKPSKMAQQAHASAQYQADTSETATTGSSGITLTASASATASKRDDDNSASSSTHGGMHGGSMQGSGHGEGSITFDGSKDFNQPITGDFNTRFSLSGRHNGYGWETGDVSCDIRVKGPNDFDATIVFDVNQQLSNGNTMRVRSDPNIRVDRSGSREAGQVMRMIAGIERRSRDALDANGQLVADDSSAAFDFSINHNNTMITDTFAANELTQREISGTLTVVDNSDQSTSTITFDKVVRGKPGVCLCPSGGTIDVKLTANGKTEDHSYTFGSVCGQVSVTSQTKATAAADVSDGNSTASTSASSASSLSTETWPLCVPTSSST